MAMRNRVDKEYAKLDSELIEMGELCETAIAKVFKGLFENDVKELIEVGETESVIDEKEREIENMCFRLMMRQHPVASDLRNVSSALKIITDMERIGDYAADIAESARYVGGELNGHGETLKGMYEAAISMMKKAIQAFADRDVELAREVMKDDDIVDDYFESIRSTIIDIIREGVHDPKICLDLMMITRYLERIGDHAVNIAVWTEFAIKGVHESVD